MPRAWRAQITVLFMRINDMNGYDSKNGDVKERSGRMCYLELLGDSSCFYRCHCMRSSGRETGKVVDIDHRSCEQVGYR